LLSLCWYNTVECEVNVITLGDADLRATTTSQLSSEENAKPSLSGIWENIMHILRRLKKDCLINRLPKTNELILSV